MELRVLRYFLMVAREETISGAAEVLHVTQPTLSRQMKDLEEELGVTLFRRGNRCITLTDEGMRLRKRAEEIVDLVDKTEAEFSLPEEAVSGDVYIGSGETYVLSHVAQVMKQLQVEHPLIRFHIHSGNAEDVTERLDKGLLDFGVLIQPTSLLKYDHLSLPDADVWGVLMRKDSPLAEREIICPEDLWSVPLLASRQRLVSEELSAWFKKDYEELNVVATYNLIYNAAVLVEQGIGYALCLNRLIDTSGNNPLCFRPLEPRLTSGLNIVWKKYQVFSKAAEIFHKRIQETFSDAPEQSHVL